MDAAAKIEVLPTRETIHIVIVGHVDHGKSTLVGRLLADTGTLPEGKLEKVKATCTRTGKAFEYAFLLDALEAEQDQGITIDAARVFFRSQMRDYIIIDAPGHVEFLKNMVTGAARAETAILLIDAGEGVQENSRRHGYLLAMLGISQVVVVVNKMDLVDYRQDAFEEIVREYRAFLAEVGVKPACFVPVSAREGELISESKSDKMPWFDGPSVLDAMDQFTKAPAPEGRPLRLPIQDVYKWGHTGDDKRILAGRVESGQFKIGDEVLFLPSGKRSVVERIEGFNLPETPTTAYAGRSTGLTLREQLFVGRGELMSHPDRPPAVARVIRVKLFWLGRRSMERGKTYKLKLATAQVDVTIAEIHRVLDASDLDASTANTEVGRHDVADLELRLRKPIALDCASENESTGRFVIVDGFDIAGGGIVSEVVQFGATHQAEAEENSLEAIRATHFGHRACLVTITGEGAQRVAADLERSLVESGHHAYFSEVVDEPVLVALLAAGAIVLTAGEVPKLAGANTIEFPVGEARRNIRVQQIVDRLASQGRLRI